MMCIRLTSFLESNLTRSLYRVLYGSTPYVGHMGLDSFKTEESRSKTQKSEESDNNSKSKNNSSSKKSKHDPFKTVGVGRNKKVFETEEMWNDVVEYVEEEMGFEMSNVLNWSDRFRHKALHIAILNSRLDENREFNITRTCFVCGETFKFPDNWNFVEYKGNELCPTHEFGEVLETYKENQGEYDGS